MIQDPDEDRIRRKAHELWEAEGHPHGRDRAHWEQAREIIAIEDSMASTLLPRDTGAREPVEPALAVNTLGDLPNLTDQGEHALTDTGREPAQLQPGAAVRPSQARTPGIDDAEVVSTPVAPVAKPAAPATRSAHDTPASVTRMPVPPAGGKPASVTGKTASKTATNAMSMIKVSKPGTSRKTR